MIHCLILEGHVVHVTAPTNAAVREVAERVIQKLSYDNFDDEIDGKYRLADFLLFGSNERMKVLSENDPILSIMNYSRHLRLNLICENIIIERNKILHQLTDLLTRNIDEQRLVSTFHNELTTMTLKFIEYFTTLLIESPASYLQSITSDQIQIIRESLDSLLDAKKVALKMFILNLNDEQYDHDNEIYLIYHNFIYSIKAVPIIANISTKEILNCAKVVFSTVNSAGSFQLYPFKPPVVIVDEATQLIEPELAIILANNSELRCLVLVGDDNQLPSTVISKHCQSKYFGESLFSHLFKRNYPYSLLNTQYRMHPDISLWPSNEFYDGNIINGANVTDSNYHINLNLPRFAIYDIKAQIETTDINKSKCNESEVRVIQQLVTLINQTKKSGNITIGVISPYAGQICLLEGLRYYNSNGIKIKVSTIDGFQGQECDIIIFSCVRSNNQNKIGFLNDYRRLNVAMTRAKHHLFVICDCKLLKSDNHWFNLITYSENNQIIFTSKTSDIIKKVTNAIAKLEDNLINALKPGNDLLNKSIWKIIFTNDFKVSCTSLPVTTRNNIVLGILLLGEGRWQKYESNRNISEMYRNMLHIYRTTIGLYIVWSIDIDKTDNTIFKQCIRIWDIVMNQNNILKVIQKIEKGYSVYSNEYIDKCCTKMTIDKKLYVPSLWPYQTDFIWKKPITSTLIESLEQSDVETSITNTKFYGMYSQTLRLLAKTKMNSKIELPFDMSADEETIITHPSSVFILGRSGTGKTTAMLHRMFLHNMDMDMDNNKIQNEIEFKSKSLMITASPILRDAIISSYEKMLTTATATIAQEANNNSNNNSNNNNWIKLNEKELENRTIAFIDMNSFPLIITYRTYLKLLDNLLIQNNNSFYNNILNNKQNINQNQNENENMNDNYYENQKCNEVDYYRFINNYSQHFNNNKYHNIDPSLIFTEIMSVIKGSLEALKSKNGILNRQNYCFRSQLRHSTLNNEIRNYIYDEYEKYEKYKLTNNDYDILDVVRHIYQNYTIMNMNCSLDNLLPNYVTEIYVDEVQDLTPAEITLFRFASINYNGFVFAGDTAQTVSYLLSLLRL